MGRKLYQAFLAAKLGYFERLEKYKSDVATAIKRFNDKEIKIEDIVAVVSKYLLIYRSKISIHIDCNYTFITHFPCEQSLLTQVIAIQIMLIYIEIKYIILFSYSLYIHLYCVLGTMDMIK
jgi:hypothetical protein